MRADRAGALFGDKIKKPAVLRKITGGLKKKGRKIVFTNGCFDLLHYGHARYLHAAKAMGDILLVAVNSDASVRKIKGCGRPLMCQRDRAGLVASLIDVDYVTVFNEETPLKLIKLLVPDVLVKGADWGKKNIVGGDFVKSRGGRVATVKLSRGRSTTALIKRIGENYLKHRHSQDY